MSVISLGVVVVGLLAVLVVIGAIVLVFLKRDDVNLTAPSNEKPEWMKQTPPAETVAATFADNEGVQVYNHDAGEKLAAPFAEQIEDIVQARLKKHPELSQLKVDFGSAPDGSLEIWVNDEKFSSVDALPEGDLKNLVKEAIESWQKTS